MMQEMLKLNKGGNFGESYIVKKKKGSMIK